LTFIQTWQQVTEAGKKTGRGALCRTPTSRIERSNQVKIAFTTSGDSLDAPLDSRFGRAPSFLIYDLDARAFSLIDNQQSLNAAQGAGIQAAETVARSGAKGLVTGHCGPKAFRVLAAAGIKVFSSTAPTVAAALEQYRAGQLNEAESADVEGHWA
jgi:predicted Fe-Mo cluster-binding NifX family protein